MNLRIIGASDFADDLLQYARDSRREGRRAVRGAGRRVAQEAESQTFRDDLLGATRQFAGGWEHRFQHRAGVSLATVFNSAPHSYFAQRGRGPGKMPPARPIRAWMKAKGIPMEAEWPIRKSIERLGTIRRFGATPGPAGSDPLHTATDRAEPAILRELVRAHDRAFGRLGR